MKTFEKARAERRRFAQTDFVAKPLDIRPQELPPLKLDHLLHITDGTGILQHATFTVPNYSEGYTTDDNARALLVSTLLEEIGNPRAVKLATRYMAFVLYAFNYETRSFRNFMDYQRQWLEDTGSEDSHGRSLWALGVVLGRSNTPSLHNMAGRIFEQSLLGILKTTSPRSWAFALLGIYEYLQRFDGDRRASQVCEELGGRLLRLYNLVRTNDWPWFEEGLYYCNATMPHALLLAGKSLQNQEMMDAALESLRWLVDVQSSDKGIGHFVPIGSNGFYEKGGHRAHFDQQPVEAQATISACLDAYRLTNEKFWFEQARLVFEWFLGRNDLNLSVYDPTTGGCRDGLHPDRLNENEGAESTLAFLQSLLELKRVYNTLYVREHSNEQTIISTVSPSPIQPHPDRFELAISSK